MATIKIMKIPPEVQARWDAEREERAKACIIPVFKITPETKDVSIGEMITRKKESEKK